MELTGLSRTIHLERYAHPGETTWEQTADRVATYVAKAEDDSNFEKSRNESYELIKDLSLIPGGRILSNAGRPDGHLLNCFCIGVNDSRESIGEMLKECLVISGTGGGVGISFRNLRYKGATIKTVGGKSSGAVSFMEVVDAVASTIKTGGGRRAALMLSLPVWHPDILDFLHHKLDLEKLTNANISIEVDDDFIDAVRKNKKWDLTWAGQVVKTVKAREIWDIFTQNALKSGEPGMLNFGLAEAMSNSWYFHKFGTTNPCGEIFLPESGVCCLASLNLVNFLNEDKTGLDLKKFRHAAAIGVRFLDNVLTVNSYPLASTKETATSERRIGLGLTGVHSAMLELGIKYSTREGVEFIEHCYEELRNASYKASSLLAKEKGSFAKFDCEKYLESGFAKTLPASIRRAIRKNGMRNVCVNTQAPVGTTSMLAGVSSGIEPIPAPIYKRTFYSEDGADSTGRKQSLAIDPFLARAILNGATASQIKNYEGAHDIPVLKHFEAQEAAQRYIDNSVSKTLNLPHDYTQEELSNIMLKFAKTIKGTTIYRQGSRAYEPIQPVPLTPEAIKEVMALGADKLEAELNGGVEQSCKSGSCDI